MHVVRLTCVHEQTPTDTQGDLVKTNYITETRILNSAKIYTHFYIHIFYII